ncbi:CocE/NonD family hydrolase [Amycolatopsis sp. cmx-11-12]|uniref:CocE/NonD family hydrolase n=1 Tax=Amycolatopsis sp. cmx-11-12 TaxID=2785795 RepID=UPI003917BC93
MTVLSRLLGAMAGLPPTRNRHVGVVRGLRIPMPDGTVLRADRWFPDNVAGNRAPILLTRLPYGRGGLMGLVGRIYAERGYQVLIVSCRGTFGSGGEWVPFRNERADGVAVFDWLSAQPWFSGRVGLFGASYFGLTQWAVAGQTPSWVRSMALAVTSANFGRFVFPSAGLLALESATTWLYGLEHQERGLLARWVAAQRMRRRKAAAYATLSLDTVDEAAVGHRVDWFQDWLVHDSPDDPWWSEIDFGRDLDSMPPVSMVAGWYDIFVIEQLAEFEALRTAGRQARLTVGPWKHASAGTIAATFRDALDWADIHLNEEEHARERGTRVRVFVMGARRWVDLPDWPPPADSVAWHLHTEGVLSLEPSKPGRAGRHRYDPAAPTPSVGGRSLDLPLAGPKDNRRLEARPDVLTYTTDALIEDLTVIGQVRAVLYVTTTVDYTDFFVRLCDVAPNGRSTNLCDAVVRVTPTEIDRQDNGAFPLTITLSPTANTFARGHRMRLQISGGAHPLYSRNPGSGEPAGKVTTSVPVEHQILHDPEHPSRVELPTVGTVRATGPLARMRTRWT